MAKLDIGKLLEAAKPYLLTHKGWDLNNEVVADLLHRLDDHVHDREAAKALLEKEDD